ncbi:drug/metabolite transporter (DMT)-like permease [Pedobacter sp. CG_S7]|uniref:DMT family transporter n=1 Tax=Pedobacter sp. CG_S7 TaxID=3143930 RepID=UPI0033918A26
MILSLLMIVIANGLTTVAEQTITSGLTSLLISLVPILVYLGSLIVKLQKPSFKGFAGVILGFLGVAFIFREGLGDILDPDYKIGMLYLSLAIAGWAVGTIYIKKNVQHSDNIFLDLFYQFLFSVVVQFVLAFVFSGKTNISSWSFTSLMATAYLGIVGSVLGFFCFHYALKRVSVVKVSILSYFNTIIAIFLGWIVLGEVITTDVVIAAVLIITGVFIVNYKKKNN